MSAEYDAARGRYVDFMIGVCQKHPKNILTTMVPYCPDCPRRIKPPSVYFGQIWPSKKVTTPPQSPTLRLEVPRLLDYHPSPDESETDE